MEASLALGGQVIGRIESVRPVDDIIADTMAGFYACVSRLAATYSG